jgi:predicted RNA-binding Zn-ribbon protein involved in translation (DUF1610 family)
MVVRDINPERKDEDWEGNNAAFTCPACGKVFIVSERIHNGSRACPGCGRAKGYVSGVRNPAAQRESNGKPPEG